MDYENEMLKKYKDINDIYENQIQKYKGVSSTSPEEISSIIIDNDSWTTVKWALISTSNWSTIYETDKYPRLKRCTINLNDINIPDGPFKLKANVTGSDSVSAQQFVYNANSNRVAYFKLKGNAFNTDLYLTGIEKMSIVQCSRIIADNNAIVVTKWGIQLLDGKLIYMSGGYTRSSTYILNLRDISVPSGTQFKLKALVEGGNQSTSSVILEYREESTNTAKFVLEGSAFKTTLTY